MIKISGQEGSLMKNGILFFLVFAMVGSEICCAAQAAIKWFEPNVFGVMGSPEQSPIEALNIAMQNKVGLVVAIDGQGILSEFKSVSGVEVSYAARHSIRSWDQNCEGEVQRLLEILAIINAAISEGRSVVIYSQRQENGAVDAILTAWVLAHAVRDTGFSVVEKGAWVPECCAGLVRLHMEWAVMSIVNLAGWAFSVDAWEAFFCVEPCVLFRKLLAVASTRMYERFARDFSIARSWLEPDSDGGGYDSGNDEHDEDPSAESLRPGVVPWKVPLDRLRM